MREKLTAKGRELTVLATKEQSILLVETPFLQTGCKTNFKNSAEKLLIIALSFILTLLGDVLKILYLVEKIGLRNRM